jgi:RNA polymerase sigma factor (TIGR02999 family)
MTLVMYRMVSCLSPGGDSLGTNLAPPIQAQSPPNSGHGWCIFLTGLRRYLSKEHKLSSPSGATHSEITGLLQAWSTGDEAALARLAEHVYPELRAMARRHMRNEREANTLQTTALVNEVYLRLVDVTKIEWQQRAQFFAMAAQMMRRILVDAARSRGADKRGGKAVKVNLDEALMPANAPSRSIIALDEALTAFAQIAPRQAKVVELRYFGGLTEEEITAALKISPRTVRRDWDLAKAWLLRELSHTIGASGHASRTAPPAGSIPTD